MIIYKYFSTFAAVRVSPAVVAEVRRIIEDSEVTREDDNSWPAPDKNGRQELEIKSGREHISFTVINHTNAMSIPSNTFKTLNNYRLLLFACSVKKLDLFWMSRKVVILKGCECFTI